MAKMKIVKIGGMLVLLLVVFLIATGPSIAEWFAFRGQPDEIRAEYRDFKFKTLEFPADALEIEPVSAQTRDLAEALAEAWKQHGGTNMAAILKRHETAWKDNGEALDAAALEADVADVRPVLDAWQRLVERPDYDVNVIPQTDGIERPDLPLANYLVVQSLVKLGALDAVALAHGGQGDAALDRMDAVYRSVRSHPCDTMISRMVAVAVGRLGAQAEWRILARIDDPELLRKALERQQSRSANQVALPEGIGPKAIDYLGVLRRIKSAGADVPALEPMTERELCGVMLAAQADYVRQIALPTAGDQPDEKARLEMTLESYTKQAALFGAGTEGGGVLARYQGKLVSPIIYVVGTTSLGAIRTREDAMLAQCDLLRLETARRLYALEQGTSPARLEALAPDYLAELPADRFAEDGASYRLNGGVIYSIGPDGDDDGGRVAYRAGSGARSDGDLFFAAESGARDLAAARVP